MNQIAMPQTDAHVSPEVEAAAHDIWAIKEECCATRDHYDVWPIVQLWRNGVQIVELITRLDRDYACAAAHIMSVTGEPDLVIASLDAHVTRTPLNPATGEPWERGEMQAACDNDGACSTGLLTDAITTMGAFRDGRNEMLTRTYHGHEKAGGLTWSSPTHLVDDGTDPKLRAGGIVIDRLRACFTESPVINEETRAQITAKQKAEGLNDDEVYWHRVVAGARMALTSGAALGLKLYPTEGCEWVVAQNMTEEAMREWEASQLGQMSATVLASRYGLAG